MERTTIARLKARLSAYLKKVRAGQTILILDRDEPIARLERVSAEGEGPQAEGDRLTRLERAGLLRRASRRVSVDALRKKKPRAAASVVDALLEDRRGGR